ncbi:VOC family protein [Kitasatospora sp. NPDC057500]|uniref:VOC family protein n=1 Tax=Kitasatospora sp. NPDC057500 TaxID=3346151 RepID=UPI0036B2A961
MTGADDGFVPERYRYAAVPHVMVGDAAGAIDFHVRAFGAREDVRIEAPGGGVLHAEIGIGRSVLMPGDVADGAPFTAPTVLGGTSVALRVHVPDADALAERAAAAGAEVFQPPATTAPYGSGTSAPPPRRLALPQGRGRCARPRVPGGPGGAERRRIACAAAADRGRAGRRRGGRVPSGGGGLDRGQWGVRLPGVPYRGSC